MNKFITLSDVAELTVGFVGTMSRHYTHSGVPFLRSLNINAFEIITDDLKFISKDFCQKLSKSILYKDDIAIVRTGDPGTCCVISDEFSGCNCSDVIIVRPNKNKIDPNYLAAYINIYGKKQIDNNKVGAVQKHFNVHSAENMLIYMQPLEVQREISNVIVSLNKKIQLNKKIASELESMAKTLYDYWFVQFDFPDENGKPYRSSGGEMVWNEELKREIPKGWKVGKLESIGSIVSGGTPNTACSSYYSENGIAWITPNDLSKQTTSMFVSHGERDITSEGLQNSSATLMPKNSVVFTTRAPIGYIAISCNEISTNQGFKSIVTDKQYGCYFIYYTLKNNTLALIKRGNGTTFKEVSKSVFASFEIVIPPIFVDEKFEKILKVIGELRKNIEQEVHELTKLRDWLLPMLMNGQVSIRDGGEKKENTLNSLKEEPLTEMTASATNEETPVRQKRGRPRKNPFPQQMKLI